LYYNNITIKQAEITGINDPPLPPRVCAKAKCAEKVPAHLDYWYRGYCKDKFPDFAALAVFESQTCSPIQRNDEDSLCVSRYRIIRILDSASDTLKKEYIEVKEYPLLPCFRYRPILIFGEYNNGTIQIKWYEDVREYFFSAYLTRYLVWKSSFLYTCSFGAGEGRRGGDLGT
jgi:hypothetical protein